MLPDALRFDAWWFSDDLTVAAPPDGGSPSRQDRRTISPMLAVLLAALCLVGLGDVLVYGHSLGLGLVLFMLIASTVGLGLRHWQGRSVGRGLWAAAALGLGLLPVLEYVQALSLMFGLLGAVIFVAVLSGGTASAWRKIKVTALFWLLRFGTDAPKIAGDLSDTTLTGVNWRRTILGLLLPASVGLTFAGLLLAANPVLESLAVQFDPLVIFADLSPWRVGFWIVTIILVWPILRSVEVQRSTRHGPTALGVSQARLAPFLNAAAVRQTLILCNGLFLIQGITDLGYLLAGVELPAGMTYAQYAHRGAYPLLATALLAGGIATATAGFARRDPWIRALSLFWMVQTLMLVGSSVFRLSLYIDAYGLTLLRMWAGVWMALVLAGICLVFVQIWQARSALWLINRNMMISAATLYLCCFFNFTQYVASYNFRHLGEETATEYACALGDHAAGAYFSSFGTTRPVPCFGEYLSHLGQQDWREWSFRKARMDRALATVIEEMKQMRPEMFEWRYGEVGAYENRHAP
ncbi:MAG: DUF4173 domain-containing protein [Albidovulum sp.]